MPFCAYFLVTQHGHVVPKNLGLYQCSNFLGVILLKFINNCAPLLLALAVLGWAGNTIAGRFSEGVISPLALVFLRWSIVVVLLVSFRAKDMIASWPVMVAHWRWTLAMGTAGFTGFNVLYYLAAQNTTAVNLGLLQCVMPIYVMIGCAIAYKIKVAPIQMVGIVLSLLGVAFVLGRGDLSTILAISFNDGDAIMLLAAMFYAGYTVGLRKRPEVENFTMLAYLSLVAWFAAAVLLLADLGFEGSLQWPSDLSAWAIILYVALVPSLLSQILFIRGVQLVGSNKAGVYSNLLPIYVAVLGVVLLGEKFENYHLIATILAGFGIYLVSKPNVVEKNRD